MGPKTGCSGASKKVENKKKEKVIEVSKKERRKDTNKERKKEKKVIPSVPGAICS
jgi:hypothetical protein